MNTSDCSRTLPLRNFANGDFVALNRNIVVAETAASFVSPHFGHTWPRKCENDNDVQVGMARFEARLEQPFTLSPVRCRTRPRSAAGFEILAKGELSILPIAFGYFQNG